MDFIAAGDDIRPHWPFQQLAATVPRGTFSIVPDVPHDFWSTDPEIRVQTVLGACMSS